MTPTTTYVGKPGKADRYEVRFTYYEETHTTEYMTLDEAVEAAGRLADYRPKVYAARGQGAATELQLVAVVVPQETETDGVPR